MLLLKCNVCKHRVWVKGYTTADSLYEPGEVIVDEESIPEESCVHILVDANYTIVDEEYETFDDDVI